MSDWVAIYDDAQGIDFAAIPLAPFIRRGLEAAGVSAIALHAVAPAEFLEDSQLVLAGVPSESVRRMGADTQMKFLLVPLTVYKGDDLPAKGRSLLAALPEAPEDPFHRFNDVAGMSGCPVFRIATKAGMQKRYWLVGVQSGWCPARGVVRLCPIQTFSEVLAEAAVEYQKRFGRPAGA